MLTEIFNQCRKNSTGKEDNGKNKDQKRKTEMEYVLYRQKKFSLFKEVGYSREHLHEIEGRASFSV